jgi:hypothetical protein
MFILGLMPKPGPRLENVRQENPGFGTGKSKAARPALSQFDQARRIEPCPRKPVPAVRRFLSRYENLSLVTKQGRIILLEPSNVGRHYKTGLLCREQFVKFLSVASGSDVFNDLPWFAKPRPD